MFWGLDPLSRAAVTSLVKTKGDAGPSRLVAFEPQADARRELRDAIVAMREAARPLPGSPEPRVALLTTTFGADAAGRLDRLREVSEILDVIQPGLRSLALVVLVPPPVAEDREKIETFECFLRLEQVADTIPFLDLTFVHQLPAAFYRQQEDASAGELIELVARDFCDADLDVAIQGTGRQLVALGTRVSGRKCQYATVGSYHLHYPAVETLTHLEARLCRDVFLSGFMTLTGIDEERRFAIQARADACVTRRIHAFDARGGDQRLGVSGQALRSPSADAPTQERMYQFQEEVTAALKSRSTAMADELKGMANVVRGELVDVLADSTFHLATARLYSDALSGTLPIESARGGTIGGAGAARLHALLCRERLVQALAAIAREQISALIQRGAAISPQADEETETDWLRRVLGSLGPVSSAPSGLASPARFMAAVAVDLADLLGQSPFEPDAARALVERLADAFASEATALGAIVKAKEDEETRLQDDMRTRFGWVARNVTRRAEREALSAQIAAATSEKAALLDAHASMHSLLMAIVNRAVLPHVVRTRFSRAFEDAVRLVAREVEAFVSAIAGALDDTWSRARIPPLDTSTATSVITPAKIDALFEMLVQRRRMAELAHDALRFFPTDPGRSDRSALVYGRCRHLGDHFLAGPASLVARLADFAGEMCHFVRTMDILDVVELADSENAGGDRQDRADAYLRDKVACSRRFLEFSSGMCPLVEHQQVMHTIFSVRTAGGERSRLAREYGHLFGPQREYVDSRDPLTIHIACLIVAFPAFLIHALEEGRRLFQAEHAPMPADLWPEPTRAQDGRP